MTRKNAYIIRDKLSSTRAAKAGHVVSRAGARGLNMIIANVVSKARGVSWNLTSGLKYQAVRQHRDISS